MSKSNWENLNRNLKFHIQVWNWFHFNWSYERKKSKFKMKSVANFVKSIWKIELPKIAVRRNWINPHCVFCCCWWVFDTLLPNWRRSSHIAWTDDCAIRSTDNFVVSPIFASTNMYTRTHTHPHKAHSRTVFYVTSKDPPGFDVYSLSGFETKKHKHKHSHSHKCSLKSE